MNAIARAGLRLAVAGLVAALLGGACTTMEMRTDRYVPPPLGSTWTNARTDTGSFGSATARVTIKRGQREWQGKQVLAFENPATAIVATMEDGNWIAMLSPGGQPIVSWDPPLGWQHPLEVGKTATKDMRVTTHANGSTVSYVATWKVEAVEDVTVPAGTFKCFRIGYSDTLGNQDTYWTSPELNGIFVKSIQTRTASHQAGPGTRRTELVSQTIRK